MINLCVMRFFCKNSKCFSEKSNCSQPNVASYPSAILDNFLPSLGETVSRIGFVLDLPSAPASFCLSVAMHAGSVRA